MATIENEVNPAVAAAYYGASQAAQKKVQLLLNVWLPALTDSTQSLGAVKDAMSDEAEANGLTDDILATLLRDELLAIGYWHWAIGDGIFDC